MISIYTTYKKLIQFPETSNVKDIIIFMDANKQRALQDASVLQSLENRLSSGYCQTGSFMGIASGEGYSAFDIKFNQPYVVH